MPDRETLPYGAWRSPITSDLIVGEAIGLGDILVDGNDIYWIEARPGEGGRNVVVRRAPDGAIADVTPAPLMRAPGFTSMAAAPPRRMMGGSSSAISPISGSTSRWARARRPR